MKKQTYAELAIIVAVIALLVVAARAADIPTVTAMPTGIDGTITGKGFGVKPGQLWTVCRFDASALRGNERAGKYLAYWDFNPPSGRVAVPKEAVTWGTTSIRVAWSTAVARAKFLNTLRHSNSDLVIDDPFPTTQCTYVVETAAGEHSVTHVSPQVLDDALNIW